MPVASRHGAATSRVHGDHGLGALVRVLLVVHGDLDHSGEPDGRSVSTERDVAQLFVAGALPVAPVLVGGPLEAFVAAFPVPVGPVVFDAAGFLPRNPLFRERRGVHGVQLVVERSDAIPFQLQVEVAVHVLQEVLEPVGGRWLACQPIDVARVMLDQPPELKLFVLPKSSCFDPRL